MTINAPEQDAHGGRRRGGRLFVVATPIGNLGDLSRRAAETLASVDWVFAEDTRVTRVLLDHCGATPKARPLHEHNEAAASQVALELLREGRQIAIVSDAGTPGISDPGARLVRLALEEGIEVVPIPGPNAAIAALSVAGFEGPFAFVGFLPASPGARRQSLARWRAFPHTLVLYEAPHRIAALLSDAAHVLGEDRRVVIARELTKRFETLRSLRLGEATQWIKADANHERGEFVVLIEGAPSADAGTATAAASERVLRILMKELPPSRATALTAEITGARRKPLYERALAIAAETREGSAKPDHSTDDA